MNPDPSLKPREPHPSRPLGIIGLGLLGGTLVERAPSLAPDTTDKKFDA